MKSSSLLALLVLVPIVSGAQTRDTTRATPSSFNADSARLAELPWRNIGPAITSGRIVDFAAPEGPRELIGSRLGALFYVASASGGVWKTTNGRTTWGPILDKQSTMSVGGIRV